MFRPGPSSTSTPSARASRPSASPIRSASAGSHEFATVAAVGKHVAFSEAAIPRWSPSPS